MEPIKRLHEMLESFETIINESERALTEENHINSLLWKKIDRLPLMILPEEVDEELYPLVEAFNDPCKMMINELIFSRGYSIYSSIPVEDDYPYHIRSNHGIGIMASLFGLESVILENNMPWVQPIESRDEVLQMVRRGLPDLTLGLSGRLEDTYGFFKETLKNYPKCSRWIKLSLPDMQGPFDIAHLIIGADIFFWLYDDRELIHDLLDLITQTFIAYRNKLGRLLNEDENCNHMYIHGGIYLGRILVKEDTPLNTLSPEMYDEFSLPYLNKIFNEFPGSLHSCGKMLPWHFKMLAAQKLHSINFGNPEKQCFDEIYSHNRDNNTGIIGWGYNQPYQFLKTAVQTANTGITLACKVKNIEEGKKVMEIHKSSFL